MTDPKAIAIYLPQFHPIPENDLWWGKGFTEWRNVVNARPLYHGHCQPHLPSDLGFYDLRLSETRIAQAKLAQEHGIHGFCYYHYWFNGRRVLERPFQEVLETGEPDFPFCLCWANENWTRRWDGQANEILLRQEYNEADDVAHIKSLLPAFHDKRYIRINGKPLFIIYRVNELPNPERTSRIWQEIAKSNGLGGIYLVVAQAHDITDPREIGFDAAMEFQPALSKLLQLTKLNPTIKERLKGKLKHETPAKAIHFIYEYSEACDLALSTAIPPYIQFPCVTPSWDNTARRRWGGLVLHGSTPELYGQWLSSTIKRMDAMNLPEQFIFINAWNEWAEGNHLEPDQRWGTHYLQQTLRALEQNRR
jgi:lipopolysaccharide biosynthesis protein